MENKTQKVVLLVSPFSGANRKERARNEAYAIAAMRDAFARCEVPVATHVLFGFSGVLDNAVSSERAIGIDACKSLAPACASVVAYVDYGTTDGMRRQMDALRGLMPVELRVAPGWRWPSQDGPDGDGA